MRAILTNVARLGRNVPVSPATAIAGMGLISFGVALIYLPAGIIAGGLFLIAAAIDSRS
jgi:hypothetical protein